MRVIDFRSDTVTRPSQPMRQAMAFAEVGDDVYGEDPTVRALEERIAARLGHEAALFVPSGTQANQIAIGLHCRPGDEVVLDGGSHTYCVEGGGLAALWGVQARSVPSIRGVFTPEAVSGALSPESLATARSRLVVIENTHTRGGGRVWPLETYSAVVKRARESGLGIHLDGARLFNAEVATGVPVSAYGKLADTVSVAFSKGLGAPVGSALCSSSERIHEARRLRKRLGGGMRQAGILAAAGLFALDHHIPRLAEDHLHARKLAAGLAELPGITVDLTQVETNIVFAFFERGAAELVAVMRKHGVLASPEGSHPDLVRLVTHLDVSAADVDETLTRLRSALSG